MSCFYSRFYESHSYSLCGFVLNGNKNKNANAIEIVVINNTLSLSSVSNAVSVFLTGRSTEKNCCTKSTTMELKTKIRTSS